MPGIVDAITFLTILSSLSDRGLLNFTILSSVFSGNDLNASDTPVEPKGCL